MHRHCPIVAVLLVLATALPAAGSRLEEELSRRLQGAWGVLEVEVYSDCNPYYNDNEVQPAGVSSKADRRFDPGELVKVDKINLKRSRLDLFLELAEPVLMARVDGPFELFDERSCRVQLMVELPRELVKDDDAGAILDQLGRTIATAPGLGAARELAGYNRRQREPYPSDYELTLARYEVWKAEQLNAAVAARITDARADALRASSRIQRHPEYLDGFAAGVDSLRSWSERDCPDLLDARVGTVAPAPPADASELWRDGYRDGQLLQLSLQLAERLQGCFVPVPPPGPR